MAVPKIAWSESYLDALELELGDRRISLCLSPITFHMLADMSKMVMWPTRWLDLEGDAVSRHGLLAFRELNIPESCEWLNGDDMTEQEVIDLINQRIEEMTIYLNNYVNCGGCGTCNSSPCSCPTDEEALAPPDGYEIPLPDDDVQPGYVESAEKCDRANYAVFQFRLACLQYFDNLTSYPAFDSFWEAVTGALWRGVPFAYDSFLRIREWAKNQMITGDFTDAFDQHFNAIVCRVFSADSVDVGRQNAIDYMEQNVFSNVSPLLALVYRQLWYEMPLQSVYDAYASVSLPDGFVGRQCCNSTPGETTPLPELPPEYVYMVPMVSEFDSDSDQWSTSYLNGVTSVKRLDTLQDCGQGVINVSEFMSRYDVSNIVGAFGELLDGVGEAGEGLMDFACANGPDFYFDSMADGRWSSVDSSEYANVTEFAAIVDNWGGVQKTYATHQAPSSEWATRINITGKQYTFRFVFIGRKNVA